MDMIQKAALFLKKQGYNKKSNFTITCVISLMSSFVQEQLLKQEKKEKDYEAKMKKYSLYPELSEEGKKEAQRFINEFKERLKKVVDEVVSDAYCNVVTYIESDSWDNFRNEIMDGFKNYDNRKIQAKYNFKEIRQSILKFHKDDIIKDLNQDNLKEIENLKDRIRFLEEIINNR